MKTKNLIRIAFACFVLLAGNAYAQDPSIGITDGSAAQGQPVGVNMEWAPGASDFPGLQFDVAFDATKLSFTGCVLNAPYSTYPLKNCSEISAGRIQVVLLVQLTGTDIPVPEGTLGELSFTIANDAPFSPPSVDLVVENVVLIGDPSVTTNDGEIFVLGPVFNGTANGLNTMTVIQGQQNPTGTLDITNTGAAGTTLTGSCAITSDPGSVFSFAGGNTFSVLAGDPADTLTVECDSNAAINSYAGTLTCSPDGLAQAQFALGCNVTEGPQPVYGSNPVPGAVIQMMAEYEGDPIDDSVIEIDNDSGQATSVLISDPQCTLNNTSGNALSISSGGTFSIPAAGAHAFVSVSCDSSQTSFDTPFTATLSCPHNAAGSPATYDFSCVVGPKEPAVLDSDPAPGSVIDMTPGDVVIDETIADQVLTFTNVGPDLGADLDIQCAVNGDSGQISVTDLQTNTLAPGASTSVTFSCDSSVVDNSVMSYSCDWSSVVESPPTGAAGGTVSYTYNCDVRDAEVNVVSTPPDGSTLTEQVPGGGSATFNVVFGVEVDEGVDGSLVSCTVDDAASFQILSPASFPVAIPSDGTVTVSVQGNDPGGVDELSTVLRCVYEDSNTPDGGEEWTYNLVMEIGSFATFRVTKDFVDDNPATVRVELHCNHGLPLIQGFNISNDQDVNFVLGSFADGEPDCMVTEVSADGYETTYYASGQSTPTFDGAGCYFDNVGRGDVNICNITNEPLPVEIDITKEWIMAGSSGNNFAEIGTVTVSSPTEIVDGYPCNNQEESVYAGNYCKHLDFYGPATETQTVMVYPHWEGVDVYIEEDVLESYIESENDCGGSVTIYPGQGGECTVTNSVFFEGIPTLNQYGLALMALLMLGVGMVGFRRFS